MAEQEKVQTDLKNPPSLIETVDPDETPGREDKGYVGVSAEYQTATDHKFEPLKAKSEEAKDEPTEAKEGDTSSAKADADSGAQATAPKAPTSTKK